MSRAATATDDRCLFFWDAAGRGTYSMLAVSPFGRPEMRILPRVARVKVKISMCGSQSASVISFASEPPAPEAISTARASTNPCCAGRATSSSSCTAVNILSLDRVLSTRVCAYRSTASAAVLACALPNSPVSSRAASSAVICAALNPRPPFVRSSAFTNRRSISTIVANGTPVAPLIVSINLAGLAMTRAAP